MEHPLEIKPSFLDSIKKKLFILRSPWKDIILFLILIFVIIWLMSKSTERLGYYWQWYRVPQFLFKIENEYFVQREKKRKTKETVLKRIQTQKR